MDEINEEPTPNDADPIDSDAEDVVDDAVDEVSEVVEEHADDAVGEVVDEEVDEEVDVTEPEAANPPPQATAPVYDRLTRDPFATLGGVLSGIAHRYGWDVSLTRLAFIVLLIVSGGTALLAYFLAWIIIPRANHWPPPRVTSSRSRLSGRDLGIGLIGLGALVVLAVGGGEFGAALVPLAMVGGGIWLLVQNPRQPEETPLAMSTPVDASVPDTPLAPPAPMVATQPVPKRSRLRRVGLIGLLGALGLILLAVIAVPIILIALITEGDIEFSSETSRYRPASIEEIQTSIVQDAGEIELDLRSIDFETGDDPIDIDIDLDVGSIVVLLPEDVRVHVDAEADLGDVTVFGSNDDGIRPSRSVRQDDPQLDLDIDLNVGEIVVTRGGSSVITDIEVN